MATLALISGLFIGLTAFATALAIIVAETSKRIVSHHQSAAYFEMCRRLESERVEQELRAQMEKQAHAIEANALPWVAKNDKLEARYETEALERLERPEWNYSEMLDGLGK